MRKCFVWLLILALWTMPWAAQAEEESPLVVRGYGFDPYMIPAFMSDHPEIPLVIDNDFSVSRAQFISAVQSRDSSATAGGYPRRSDLRAPHRPLCQRLVRPPGAFGGCGIRSYPRNDDGISPDAA